jgi:hypothetical protein
MKLIFFLPIIIRCFSLSAIYNLVERKRTGRHGEQFLLEKNGRENTHNVNRITDHTRHTTYIFFDYTDVIERPATPTCSVKRAAAPHPRKEHTAHIARPQHAARKCKCKAQSRDGCTGRPKGRCVRLSVLRAQPWLSQS